MVPDALLKVRLAMLLAVLVAISATPLTTLSVNELALIAPLNVKSPVPPKEALAPKVIAPA